MSLTTINRSPFTFTDQNATNFPARYYRAPIDQCFRLVAILRKHWRGLSGGTEVWSEIDKFFRELDELAGGASA